MSTPDFRVGIGFDSHPLVAGRRLVLGGVDIPHDRGLEGHSDGDVLVHAIMDALLGADEFGFATAPLIVIVTSTAPATTHP